MNLCIYFLQVQVFGQLDLLQNNEMTTSEMDRNVSFNFFDERSSGTF